MFAVIMRSNTPIGVRSTAIIPTGNGATKVFSRIGESRGVSGAWQEGVPTWTPDEKVVGQAVSIPITAADYKMLALPITPTVLMQKLGRVVKGMYATTDEDAADLFYNLEEKAMTEPTSLALLQAGMQQVVTPQPVVVAPTVVAPAPTESLQESEPVMDFSTTVAPIQHISDTVLTIPDPEQYFSRTFFGKSEQEVYDYARANQVNVLLTGEAGTGKTSSARNYAATHKLPFVTIECTQQIDQSITQGRFVPTGMGNSTIWRYSQLATAIQQPSVILINELTRMSPKAASLFLRLLMERELLIEPLNQVIKVHDDVLFVADQNTGFGYTGTSKQDAALVDRFNVKLEFKYDAKLEANFIPSATLLQFAMAIRDASELSDEFSVPMSTRILQNFVAQSKTLGFEFAVNSMLNNYPKNDGERDALKMRFDAQVDEISTELGVDKGSYSSRR